MEQKIREICENDTSRWCILRHPDSDKIAKIFNGEYKTLDWGKAKLKPPFVYYIPVEDIGKEVLKAFDDGNREYAAYDPKLDKVSFRRDLSRFIFIFLDKKDTDEVLKTPWARSLRDRIGVYRDSSGEPIEIPGRDVKELSDMVRQQSFIAAISQSGPAYQEIHDGEWVKIVKGPMKGKEGEVTGIVEQDGQLLLTIKMEMFGNGLPLEIPGFNIFNVRHCEKTAKSESKDKKKPTVEAKEEELEVPLLTSFENRIIDFLSHLHGRKGSQRRNEADHDQLRAILHYANLKFPEPEESAKFKALMLLCAYLLNDKSLAEARQQEVERLLDGRTAPTSHLDCYLMTILFIVTHQPELRRQAKFWRQTHPDCPLSVRRFHSIAKLIHC